MADAPTQAILEALADALRGITTANGYHTDLGLNVRTERTETGIPTAQRCTVAVVNKLRTERGQQRPSRGRALRGVIEIEVPASFTDSMARVLLAEDDVDRRLSEYHQMPDALPVQYEETVFLDRPEGMPVVAAEIQWTTGYTRNG
ncbi:hypothetical protein [Marilutibacter alkalisoli]|uniref:DUF3168 domain-containing protein n=1 Tax=Marilutibacter alkalisoli TaxID=2591633 RepID=A0A514BU26_9GAMM|nr:hypothetical protein [Lysobacter alkalisoli]QDH70847.1 hypothetical protein FKV23_12710 [Lysobacter alkalisoli]